MLRYGITTLDKLDKVKAYKKEEKEQRNCKVPVPLGPYLNDVLDLDAILRLNQFNPNPAFQASLDSSGGIQQASQGIL